MGGVVQGTMVPIEHPIGVSPINLPGDHTLFSLSNLMALTFYEKFAYL